MLRAIFLTNVGDVESASNKKIKNCNNTLRTKTKKVNMSTCQNISLWFRRLFMLLCKHREHSL